MDTPSIYVACLASYNNGILYGKWISADQTADAIYDEIHEMLNESPVKGDEEWAFQHIT
jgi:antirestriction protein